MAVGETTHAPFSNRPCVAYEYEIYHLVSTGVDSNDRDTPASPSKDPCAFGLAKTGYVIRTSQGDVRPLGYPTLDHFSKGSCHFSKGLLEGPHEQELLARLGATAVDVPNVKRRAETYLQEDRFQEASGLGLVTALTGLAEAIEKDTDTVRKDWKVHDPENLDDMTLVETRLEVGQQVCALGKWDATRSGLQPPIELTPGDLNNAQRIMIANKRSSAVLGLIFAVLMVENGVPAAAARRPLAIGGRTTRIICLFLLHICHARTSSGARRYSEESSLHQSRPIHLGHKSGRDSSDENRDLRAGSNTVADRLHSAVPAEDTDGRYRSQCRSRSVVEDTTCPSRCLGRS